MSRGNRRRPGLTRREFVNGVLAGSAGLAVRGLVQWTGPAAPSGDAPGGLDLWNDPSACHTLAFGSGWSVPPAEGPPRDAVVIGGGLAGLVAAWRLQEAGVEDVLLLEKNGVTGGQARALEVDGVPVASMGSAYASLPYSDELATLYDALGIVTGWTPYGEPIVDRRYLLKPPFVRHFIEGDWYDDPWASDEAMDALPFDPEVIHGLRALRREVERWYDFVGIDGLPAFDWPPDRSSTDPRARALDDTTLAAWIRDNGWPEGTAAFLDPFLRSVFGIGPDRLSAWVALDFLSYEILPGDPDESAVCFPGGNAVIARGVEALLLPDTVRTNAFVYHVADAGAFVEVSFLDSGTPRTIRCRTAILACPRLIASRIVPGLPDAAAFRYGTYLVANVHVDETPPGLAYTSEVHGDLPFTDFIVADWAGLDDPANAPLSRPNILTVYAVQTDRRFVGHGPFEEIEEAVLTGLETVVPGIGETVTGFDLFRWGHPMVLDEPGFLFSAERVGSARPVGRLVFAGHETVGIPYIDSAIASGFRAASEAAGLLGRPPRDPAGRTVRRRRTRRG